MTDNTDTLEDVLKEYNCDEFECWCADKPELIQALNLYIEEKEKEAQLEVLMGFRKRDFVREDFYRVAVTDRIKELNGTPPDQITDEDIKKGWPKV